MSPTDKLLLDTFGMVNKAGIQCGPFGAVDTCQGTPAQWAFLRREGLVENTTRSGRGPLGHPFAVRLTEAGKERWTSIAKEEAR